MHHRVRKALGRKIWAVVGVSSNPDKTSYRIYRTLRDAGLEVYPVNPLYERIDGDTCYASLSELPAKPDVIDVVVNKERSLKLLEELPGAGEWGKPLTLWFQPNTYDEEVLRAAGETGHELIYDYCSMKEMKALQSRIDADVSAVVEWLRAEMKESGTAGLVLGVSGGIDSALAAALIAKASPEGALALILPCKSAPKDVEDALSVVRMFGLRAHTVDLSDEHEALIRKVESKLAGGGERAVSRMTDANLRARLRMATLYAFANQTNSLVVGTDNAAEIYTGYYTKYGDGGVDLLPLAQLLKSEVYLWARRLGVPKTVLDRVPSAGLWEGQTDEGEMGTTYEHIDDYLLGLEVPDRDRERIERMHRVTAHKRVMPPQADLGRVYRAQ